MKDKEKQIELKPCPFCGGKAYLKIIDRDGNGNEYYKAVIYCSTHHCNLEREWYWFNTRERAIKCAIEQWNTRYNKKSKLSRKENEEYEKFKSFMERNDWESIQDMEITLDKCQEVLYQRLQREYKKGYKKGKEKMKDRIFKKLFAINGRTRADIPHHRAVELAKQFGVKIKE